MTMHRISAQIPSQVEEKTEYGHKKRCVYLNFGRKRIKLFGNSGISVQDCDKIINEKQLTLPGGYQLPLGVTVETYRPYRPVKSILSEALAFEILQNAADRQVKLGMVAGQILQTEQQTQAYNGVYLLTQTTWCREMIARSEPAKILTYEEEDNGTDNQRGTDGADD